MTPPTTFEAQLRILRTLWASLVVSVLFIVVVAAVGDTPGEAPQESVVVLGVAAVVLWIASLVAPRLLFEKRAFEKIAFAVDEEAVEADRGFRTSPSKVRVLSNPEEALASYMRVYPSLLLVGLALAEATCLCGVVIALMTHVWWIVVPFAIAAWISMASKVPMRSRLIAGLERVAGAAYRGEQAS